MFKSSPWYSHLFTQFTNLLLYKVQRVLYIRSPDWFRTFCIWQQFSIPASTLWYTGSTTTQRPGVLAIEKSIGQMSALGFFWALFNCKFIYLFFVHPSITFLWSLDFWSCLTLPLSGTMLPWQWAGATCHGCQPRRSLKTAKHDPEAPLTEKKPQ